MLHEFLTENTDVILARAREKLIARTVDRPTEAALKNGLPLFLRQLVDRLRRTTTDTGEIEASATAHGGELLEMGFTVRQVVHGYGDICQVITQLADETGARITVAEFQTFNRCLDDAIAHAVGEFERRRDQSVALEGVERLGVLAHEMRNRLSTAMLAFHVLQEGTVAIGGSTGAVLARSLRELQALINNSLAGVRLESGVGHRQRTSLCDFIGDLEVEWLMEAKARGMLLTVLPVDPNLQVATDPQIFAAAIGNLLQNAFKFNHPGGTVLLRTTAADDHVVISIEDECGGLPPGSVDLLFQPFEQKGNQRSGLGLGLSICRRSVEAIGGNMTVRDVPGKGCVFAIELPRLGRVI